jgi:hypothetical protein
MAYALIDPDGVSDFIDMVLAIGMVFHK